MAQVIEYLFGPALHPELIKRSLELLTFMTSPPGCKLLPAHVQLMWSACANKHGAVTAPVSECLCELIPALPDPLIMVCGPVRACSLLPDSNCRPLSVVADEGVQCACLNGMFSI